MTTTDAAPPSAVDLRRARWAVAALAVGATAVALSLLVGIALNARSLSDWLDGLGPAGGPVVAALGAVLVFLLVPPSLICAAAGFSLGTPYGTVAALTAAVVGGTACGLFGSLVSTPATRYAFGRRIERLAAWVEARPLRAVIVCRLTPGTPFAVLGYCLGLVGVRVRDAALGTAVGFLPRCFAYVALGGSLRHLDQPAGRVALAATALLCVAVVLAPRLFVGGSIHESVEGHRHG